MIKSLEDIQKLNQANTETAMKLYGEWAKGWQTLATDFADYSKRSFEDGTRTFEKLSQAKSVEQAFEIQTSFVKRAYDEYMQQVSKVGGFFNDFAKDAYKPFERAMSAR